MLCVGLMGGATGMTATPATSSLCKMRSPQASPGLLNQRWPTQSSSAFCASRPTALTLGKPISAAYGTLTGTHPKRTLELLSPSYCARSEFCTGSLWVRIGSAMGDLAFLD